MVSRFCKCGNVCSGPCTSSKRGGRGVDYKTTKQRGYGADWKWLSERYRAEYPLCQDCLKHGKVTPSSEVHHVVPISEDESLRLTWTNLVALCNTCHNDRHVSK